MKTSLKLTLTLAASLLCVGLANVAPAATVDVYLTGANGSRGSITNGILHLLTSPQAAYTGSKGLSGSNQQLIEGTLTNAVGSGATLIPAGTQVFFHTSWGGALQGITSLTLNLPAPLAYLPDTVYPANTSSAAPGTGADSNHGPTGGKSVSTSLATDTTDLADIADSNVYQSSTQYTSPSLVQAGGASIDVLPFVWAANPDAAAFTGATGGKLSNISSTQARSLFDSIQDLAQFTGNDADQGVVVDVGRNADAGVRFNVFAETGFNPVGIGAAVTQPQQYQIQAAGFSGGPGGSTIDVSLYPTDTLFAGTPAQTVYSPGESGYSTGSAAAAALSISGTSGANSDNQAYAIGALAEQDATTVVQAGGSFISFNGVSYGSISGTFTGATTVTEFNRTLVDEGVYTLWSYDHLYYRTGSVKAALANALASQVRNTDAGVSGEFIRNLAVQRDYEGGPISYVGIGNSTK